MTEVIKRQLTRDMPDGSRVVAYLELREQGASGGLSPALSLTGDVWEKRGHRSGAERQTAGAEADSGGAMGDELAKVFPQLKAFSEAHLSDPETGEPMHAEANGFYFYAGSRADLRAVTRYTGFDSIYAWRLAERGLSDDDAGRERYCYLTACEILRVSAIPCVQDRAEFAAFVDTLRDRWRNEALSARDFILSLPESLGEDEPQNVESWTQIFGTSLEVSAKLDGIAYASFPGSSHDGAPIFAYKVKVKADGASYTTTYHGSIADHESGHYDAREAALGVLREMVPLLYQSAEEYLTELGYDLDEPDKETSETLRAMRRMDKAVDKMRDALSANEDLIS